MTTEMEWGVQFDRTGQALTVQPVNNEAEGREMVAAYRAIGVKADLVNREVRYWSWITVA